MRIIGGIAGGIHLVSPSGAGVRPTTDRVRESVFASLGDIRGQVVVDLFAGTGALGLEALSRGAAAVYLVEQDGRQLRSTELNLRQVSEACRKNSQACGTAKIIRADAYKPWLCLPALAGKIDLLLVDPPYTAQPPAPGPADLLAAPQFAVWAENALLMFQHYLKTQMPWYPLSSWKLLKQKIYGNTAVSYARAETNQST